MSDRQAPHANDATEAFIFKCHESLFDPDNRRKINDNLTTVHGNALKELMNLVQDHGITRRSVNFKWLLTFDLWAVRCEVYLEVSCTPFKLQQKPPLTIPDPYYLFLSPSENFQLHEVLPEVLPVVLLDVHHEVHFVVLTSFDYTWVIPTHPKSIWLV